MKIKVRKISEEEAKKLGVTSWGIWECEPSTFDWTYNSDETCYIIEGKVTVTYGNGQSVTIEKGDLVTFPEGLNCTWNVSEKIRKYYTFNFQEKELEA